MSLEAQVVALRTGDELAIWDMATNRSRRTRPGIQAEWSVATFSPDATILATGITTPRGVIQLWDVNALELLDDLPGHVGNVGDLNFSPDGRVLASSSGDGVVKLWDVAARVELLTLRGPFRPLTAIRFGPMGELSPSARLRTARPGSISSRRRRWRTRQPRRARERERHAHRRARPVT